MKHGTEQGNLAACNAGVFNQHFDGQTDNTPNRTMIAAMAMQGLLSNVHGVRFNNQDVNKSPENIAIAAVAYADTLLTELNKENP